MAFAVAHGHSTYDWTTQDVESPEQAALDILNVVTSDQLIILAEQHLPYKGVYVELGAALSRHIPVWVVGTGLDDCMFVQHPLVHKFFSIDPVLTLLVGRQ